MSTKFIFFALITLCLPSFAVDTIDQKLQKTLQDALYISAKPVDPDWLRAQGPNTASVLMSMYQSDHHIGHRIKLVESLSNFKDADTVKFLKDRTASGENNVIRLVAIRSLGQSMGKDSLDSLRLLLSDASPHIRLRVAETLTDVKAPEATAAVKDFLAQEKVDWVVARVKKHAAPPELAQPGRAHITR